MIALPLPPRGPLGAYGMTALYGLLPPLMAWSLRQSQSHSEEEEKSHRHLHVPGGYLALAGMELCAVAIIATQVGGPRLAHLVAYHL